MNKDEVVKMNYLLCDVLKITMDQLDDVPLPVINDWRKIASKYSRDVYEEELYINSTLFNVISVLNVEIETLKATKDKVENYETVLSYLSNRVEELEKVI